jgi:hypothetical protein
MNYYQTAPIPVYVKPNEDMLLLRLDYMGFYFPRIFFLKFELLQAILANSSTVMKYESRHPSFQVTPEKIVDCIDLSNDFLERANVARINYSEFPTFMFYLLTGNEHTIKKYKDCYEPMIPFFEYLGLDSHYMNLMV